MDFENALNYYEVPENIEIVKKSERDTAMGGTDIAALFAEKTGTKWASPLTVFFEKTGRGISEDNEYIRRGVKREKKIMEYASICLGKKILTFSNGIEEEKSLRIKEKPHLLASLDGLVFGKDKKLKVLEIKTCNRWSAKKWGNNEIPKNYQIQAQWYMHVSGLKSTIFIVEVDLWEKSEKTTEERYEYLIRSLDYDEKLGVFLEGKADRFWFESVLSGIRPDPLGLECEKKYLKKYGREEEKEKELSESEEELISLIEGRKKVLKSIESEIKLLEDKLKLSLSVHSFAEGKKYKVSYKEGQRESVDSGRLKAEKPDIFEQFKKISKTRILRIMEKGEKNE